MTQENKEAQTPKAEVVTQAVTEAVAKDPIIQRLEQELASAKGELSGRDRRISEQAKELQRTKDLTNDIASLKASIDDRFELLASAVETKLGVTGDELDEVIPKETRKSITADIKARIAEDKVKASEREAQKILVPIQQRVEALGLKPDDDDYIAIYSLAVTMNPRSIALAEKKLAEMEAKKETPKVPEEPKESEEVRINRLAEEKAKEMFKARGLNIDESNAPRGNTPRELTVEDVKKMSPEERRARRSEIAKLPLTI